MKIVFVFLSIVLSNLAYAQAEGNGYIVDFISTKQGLSHNYVPSIVTDDLNMKWVGTENGITKFNGFDFEYLKPSPAFPELLNENIEVLYMDKSHNLWIGTKSGGLSFLDIKNNEIKSYNYLIDLDQEGDMRITALSQDKDGNIWVGTWLDGVFAIDTVNDSLLHHFPSNRAVYSIAQGLEDDMWFCGGNRLYTYQPGAKQLKVQRLNGPITDLLTDEKRRSLWIALSGKESILYQYDYDRQVIDSLDTQVTSDFSRKLSLDHHNRLWIGTWGKGVYRSNDALSTFSRIDLIDQSSKRIKDNYNVILDIHHDKNNVTWLATAQGGLVKLLEGDGFQNADDKIKNKRLSRQLNCTAIYKGREHLFVGTYNGLYYGTNFSDLSPIDELGKVKVNAFYQHYDQLYIGTASGFYIFDFQKEKIIFSAKGNVRKATAFLIDEDRLFIGTQQTGLAIVPLQSINNPAAYSWYSDRVVNDQTLESNRVTEIKKDDQGRVWVSTYNGLHLFKPTSQRFVHQSMLMTDQLPSVIVNSMLLRNGFIWLATPNGLIKLAYLNDRLIIEDQINQEDGLNSDFICSATFGKGANLWLSTHTEIVKFNEVDKSVISYGETNGVRTTSFNNKSFFNEENRDIYFGGVDNLTYFRPDDLKKTNAIPEVVFTNLRVNNELIKYKPGHQILDNNIGYAEKLLLTHEQVFISIRFVVNDFLGDLNIKYRYLLEGYQDEWIDLQHRNEINFTGLNAGSYTLKVQASRDNQNWSPAKSLKINVLSPPWVSPLAIFCYLVFFVALAYFLLRAYKDRLKLKNSLEIAERDKAKEIELTEEKLNFFTNISHEFRTPLTLILAPLKELLESDKLSQKTHKNLRYIDRNTNRLLNLTNQLLDFRKADHGMLKLEVSQGNFVRFSQEVFLYFKAAAKAKGIKYKFKAKQESIRLPFDRGKMEIVLCNLLSNAIKYTPEDGKITLKVEQEEDSCVVTVKDSGVGMKAADVEKVFDRFFQIRSSQTMRLVGSGIGLAFSKEIIELHHGDLSIDSEHEVGTTFTLRLSMDSTRYGAALNEHFMTTDNIKGYNTNEVLKTVESLKVESKEHSVLIVDDNPEILSYLKDILSEDYQVTQAENGQEGFEKATKEIPDIIISDVMMPVKDGITLCKELKSQITTSHIPIILLTARTATVYEIEGLETGADDYVTKPFNARIIRARLKNLLENRDKLRAHLLNKVRFQPTSSVIEQDANVEDAFIQKAILLVEDNLDNSDFGIETMVSELLMSQSTLYRKIKSLTGLSLTGFIRSIRLKKSAELILTTGLTLKEVAYSVGFNDYKYFKTSFKKQFNCVPSKYKEQLNS